MENNSQKSLEKSQNSSPEFDDLLKDQANIVCFDCGRGPAAWASVNNSIYLCMNCAGEHRSYGVGVSYIRSITIDTWNETQIGFMQFGGNKRLEDLLKLYDVPKKTNPKVLYSSKLLDYHRSQIKNDVNKGKTLIPPTLEEALNPLESLISREPINKDNFSNNMQNSNIFSVNSSSNDFNNNEKNSEDKGNFFSSMGSMFNSAYEKGKNVASNVTEKVMEMDLTNKIINTGAKGYEVMKETGTIMKDTGVKTFDVIKDTSSKVAAKGLEYGGKVKEKGSDLVQSETVQNLKSQVEGGMSYFYGKIFGSTNQENEIVEVNKSENKSTGKSNNPPPKVEYNSNSRINEIDDDIVLHNQFTTSSTFKK